MAIRKDDRNRDARRKALTGFHGNVFAKRYHSRRSAIRAYKIFRGCN